MANREFPRNKYDVGIHVRNFSAIDKFGEYKLDHANLDIPQGTRANITGPSGSGKTLLLMPMAGIRADTTELAYGGDLYYSVRRKDAPADVRPKRLPEDYPITEHVLSFVPQRLRFDGNMTARDEMMIDVEMKGITGKEKARLERRLFEGVCRTFGIEDKINQKMSQLSGGQQARVLIAGALAGEPNILLLDESTANLDQHTKVEVNDALGRVNQEFGTTVVMVTHDPLPAPRQIHMVDGRIVSDK